MFLLSGVADVAINASSLASDQPIRRLSAVGRGFEPLAFSFHNREVLDMQLHTRRLALCSLLALLSLSITHAKEGATLRVHSGWTRASAPAQKVAMVYFTLENPGPADRLIGASASVAEAVDIHELVRDEGGNRMQEVDSVDVTARSSRNFDRDCYHLMLTGLKRPLKAGEKVRVMLRFERTGMLELPVSVRPRETVADSRSNAMK